MFRIETRYGGEEAVLWCPIDYYPGVLGGVRAAVYSLHSEGKVCRTEEEVVPKQPCKVNIYLEPPRESPLGQHEALGFSARDCGRARARSLLCRRF